MGTKGEGDEMFEVLSKYCEEKEVDAADEEALDRLAMANYIEYTLKDGGVVFARATPSAKELLPCSGKTTF